MNESAPSIKKLLPGQATTSSANCAVCAYSPRVCKHHRKSLQTTIEESVPDEETESGMSLAADTPPTVDDDASSESADTPKATYDHILDPLGDVKFTIGHLCSPSAVGPGEAVSFLASSRHLILASPVFEQMLEVAGDADVREIESDCKWQVEATIIIMRILHHKWSLVPREVDLDLLGDIAMAVDRYELYEAAQLIGRVWIERLQTALPDSYGRELKLWIRISWVFRDSEVFRHVTGLAVKLSPGYLERPQLSTPSAVIDDIDSRRRNIPWKIAQFLDDLKRKFISGEGGCNDACRFIQLGALVKNMHDLELVDRGLFKPLRDGLSLSDFMAQVQEIEPPVWYGNALDCNGSHDRNDFSPCLSCYKPHRCKKTDSSSAEQLPADEVTNTRSEKEETLGAKTTDPGPPTWPIQWLRADNFKGYKARPNDARGGWDIVVSELERDDQAVVGGAGKSSEGISGDSYGESVLKESIRDLVRKMECEMEGLDLRNYT